MCTRRRCYRRCWCSPACHLQAAHTSPRSTRAFSSSSLLLATMHSSRCCTSRLSGQLGHWSSSPTSGAAWLVLRVPNIESAGEHGPRSTAARRARGARGGSGFGPLAWCGSPVPCWLRATHSSSPVVHPLILAPRLPFLPLLATSTYCAVGVLHSSRLALSLWWAYSIGHVNRHDE